MVQGDPREVVLTVRCVRVCVGVCVCSWLAWVISRGAWRAPGPAGPPAVLATSAPATASRTTALPGA
jgi:hypothetical protein